MMKREDHLDGKQRWLDLEYEAYIHLERNQVEYEVGCNRHASPMIAIGIQL